MSVKIFTFHLTYFSSEGKMLGSSRKDGASIELYEGGGQTFPALEQIILKMGPGDKARFAFDAGDAFGPRDENKVKKYPLNHFPHMTLKVGDHFSQSDDPEADILVVKEIQEDGIILDGNHPYAGIDLVIDIEMLKVREATPEEAARVKTPE